MLTLAYRVDEIAKFFWPQDGQTLPLRPVLVMLTLLAGVCGVVWSIKAIRRGGHRSEPVRLFNQAASRLGLSWSQRWTLYRIAQRRGLSSPMTLLVCDAVLTFHADQLAQDMGGGAGAHLQRQVAAIRDRLFGQA